VLYFDGRGFCGQDISSGHHFACNSSSCSYRFPKFQIDLVRAGILVLLSCNSGRLGAGLFPSMHRLAVSASRHSPTVIAASRLFTLSHGLVEQVAADLSNGICAGDVVLRANRLQKRFFREEDVFIVFGDPAARASASKVASTTPIPVGLTTRRAALGKLAAAQDTIDALEALSLGGSAIEAVRAVVTSASEALYTSSPPRNVETYEAETMDSVNALLGIVGIELLQLTERQPFWVSTRYAALSGREMARQCWICGNAAVSARLDHHRFKFLSRQRATCSVCGVIADTPAALKWNAIRLARPTLVTIDGDLARIETALFLPPGYSPVLVCAAINGLEGSGDLVQLDRAVVRTGDDVPLLPISVEARGLRPGTWFVKVYVLSVDGLVETAVPITMGKLCPQP